MNITALRHGVKPGFLAGQMLIAMPAMPDERFARSVLYLCAHSEEGAMGFIINRRAKHLDLADLLVQLDIISKDEAIHLPQRARQICVLAGGPVEPVRGFVLHSTDMRITDSTVVIGEAMGLTVTVDMLHAIARGEGPEHAALALGYASWGPGQLEGELKANAWLHAPLAQGLVFSPDFERKYDQALGILGIDAAFLSSDAGHG